MKWWYVITIFLQFGFSGHPTCVVNMGVISHLALPACRWCQIGTVLRPTTFEWKPWNQRIPYPCNLFWWKSVVFFQIPPLHYPMHTILLTSGYLLQIYTGLHPSVIFPCMHPRNKKNNPEPIGSHGGINISVVKITHGHPIISTGWCNRHTLHGSLTNGFITFPEGPSKKYTGKDHWCTSHCIHIIVGSIMAFHPSQKQQIQYWTEPWKFPWCSWEMAHS